MDHLTIGGLYAIGEVLVHLNVIFFVCYESTNSNW